MNNVVAVVPLDEPGGVPIRKLTVDSVINEIGSRPSFIFILAWLWGTLIPLASCLTTYMGVFAGFYPTEGLVCITDKCRDKYEAAMTADKINEFYTGICEAGLERGIDYEWNLERSTFSVDLDIYCDSFIMSIYNSIYSIGQLPGILIGIVSLEYIGRRKIGAIGAVVLTIATLTGCVANNIYFLMVLRVFQGFGDVLCYTGHYIWFFEMVPTKYRSFHNAWCAVIWAVGYPTIVGISYAIFDWKMIYLAVGILIAFMQAPLLFYHDSPRYLVSVGRTDEAIVVLRKMAKLASSDIDLDNIKLVSTDNNGDDKRSALAPFQVLKEFIHYPSMLIESSILCYNWFVIALLYWGLAYGWSSFNDSIYLSYIYVAVGETIADVGLWLQLKVVGRKATLISYYALGGLCFFLAIPNVKWSASWNLERVMSMIASVFVTAAYTLVYLYSGEVAPTTHRGRVHATASLFARFSAFFGPLVSTIPGMSRVGRLILFGSLAVTTAMLNFVLPETRRRPVPELASDVSKRRKDQNLNKISGMLQFWRR